MIPVYEIPSEMIALHFARKLREEAEKKKDNAEKKEGAR